MDKGTLAIRAATEADVETVAGFNRALCLETEGRELDGDTVVEGVRRLLRDPARGRYFVAVSGRQVVGQTAHTYEWSDWRNGEIWWIQSVYVHPEFRGRGVFRALFEQIKRLGEADADCCGIRLYVERDNEAARQSYERLGFHDAGYEVLEALF